MGVLSFIEQKWLPTGELTSQLISIVIQAITVIVVAVRRIIITYLTTFTMPYQSIYDIRYLRDFQWLLHLHSHLPPPKC